MKLNKRKVNTIVKPPILTIGDLCNFLELGISKISKFFPIHLTLGPITYPNIEQKIIVANPICKSLCI